ncbi:MAG: response regulator transcription factor [Bacteroidetes bacterium]|nr:response regulator transcription factor [Bacteroidota bacterium]
MTNTKQRSKNTILFIDDEKYRMEAHAEFLSLHNFDVIYVSGFNEALEQFKLNMDTIDLIVLDIMIPLEEVELDDNEETIAESGSGAGFVIFDRFRKIKNIKTIVVSGRRGIQKMVEERKIEDYLTKPIAPKKLLEAIYEVLEE